MVRFAGCTISPSTGTELQVLTETRNLLKMPLKRVANPHEVPMPKFDLYERARLVGAYLASLPKQEAMKDWRYPLFEEAVQGWIDNDGVDIEDLLYNNRDATWSNAADSAIEAFDGCADEDMAIAEFLCGLPEDGFRDVLNAAQLNARQNKIALKAMSAPMGPGNERLALLVQIGDILASMRRDA